MVAHADPDAFRLAPETAKALTEDAFDFALSLDMSASAADKLGFFIARNALYTAGMVILAIQADRAGFSEAIGPRVTAKLMPQLRAYVVANAGAVLTDTGPWYDRLKKPSWKPPDWAFGPVWTTIFVLAVIATALAWSAAEAAAERFLIFGALAINVVLNIAWSAFFFKLRRPDWALREVALLWLSILGLIVVLGSVSTLAGILLVPYLAWVSIASFLNLRIVQLNGSFG